VIRLTNNIEIDFGVTLDDWSIPLGIVWFKRSHPGWHFVVSFLCFYMGLIKGTDIDFTIEETCNLSVVSDDIEEHH